MIGAADEAGLKQSAPCWGRRIAQLVGEPRHEDAAEKQRLGERTPGGFHDERGHRGRNAKENDVGSYRLAQRAASARRQHDRELAGRRFRSTRWVGGGSAPGPRPDPPPPTAQNACGGGGPGAPGVLGGGGGGGGGG